MTGVEIDMIVTDSRKALELYEKIFDVERVEVTDFSKGENEVIFSLYGVRFHMLDENPEFDLMAPKPDNPQTIWFNIMVPDINGTFSKAMNAGCTELQPVTELTDFGVSNAMFNDPFGYQWMLHQIHKEVSFEERMRLFEEKKEN
ncbi:PhnB protein [Virgibacillus natechei]|uniref:PhnB protein n=1 Tax=Virgibacillus natechei TaxID=1216297 RepID=A0ABS4IK25_9BACI|nr:VOC family protein [Virgibacillus natechei]MBP1971314.1 PhnB protein [Virgibacillus natechei]UZD12951.1 VOC family protein [Virgibacillus natechei]